MQEHIMSCSRMDYFDLWWQYDGRNIYKESAVARLEIQDYADF